MSPEVQKTEVANPPTVLPDPAGRARLRYMRRRRIGTADRNGDPLDGLVNLWDIALVLAVAFLLAALAGVGLSGVISDEDLTVVTNPGEPDMQVITKKGTTIETYDVESGTTASGEGTLIGEFYRLPDGSVIYVPTGEPAPEGAAPAPYPTATSTPGVYPTPGTTTPGVYSTPTPTWYPTPATQTTPPTGGGPGKGTP